ncbi:VpsR-related response regulator [Oceanisphaera sp.]|uniref:VpsR-related response regulator n=1 Tax=Oceanisphaera sp. TaxID=1929979 RepID=UPI003A915067
MALEREILVLQYSSSLRVSGIQHPDWTLVRHQNLDAAGGYLDSSEVSIGIIDCSELEQPDTKLECWLERYKGVSWIAVLSKNQLLKQEWQFFVARHCYDYHTAPVLEDKLFITVGRAYGVTSLKKKLSLSFHRGEVIGRHEHFKQSLLQLYHHTAGIITLSGESGTGKRLLVKSWANFNGLRFLEVSSSSHESNDYISQLDGLLYGGLNESACIMVAGVECLPQDVQMHICASSLELKGRREFVFCCGLPIDEVDGCGLFDSEFLMLLKSNWISIPPLRNRGQDSVLIARYYLYKLSREQNKIILGFSHGAEQAIIKYDWPGNVTELIEKIVAGVSSCEGRYLSADLMGLEDKRTPEQCANLSLRQAREEAEALAIKKALNLVSDRPGRAAELLCISRASLHRLIARYGIRR